MTVLYLDLETYSDVPITNGTHAYAEHSEILLVPYAFDNDAPHCIDMAGVKDKTDLLQAVQTMIDIADEVVLHNSAFDRTILRWHGVDLPVEKIRDTMVQALLHSLPGSLGDLCTVLRVPVDKAKDKDGKRLIHLFTKPLGKNRKLSRATAQTHPEDWQKFIDYAKSDIISMREVGARLPRWNYKESEITLWHLDQKINDRGIAVDLELAAAAQRAAEKELRRLDAEVEKLTEGALRSATQRDKTLGLVRALGVETEDLRRGTIDALLKRDDIPEEARKLLEIRARASVTSPAKYGVLMKATSSDGRLRGTLQFAGASRTARWGGRLFQPQNLPRPTLEQEDIDAGILAMKADTEDLLFPDVMELCTSAVRGCLVAPEGRKLIIADLSNIEGRMLAFLAGETWKLDAFSDFDKGIGHDLYKLAYARSFNKKPESISKDERQIGKVMELALGYNGGPGAFSVMAENYGVSLPEREIIALVQAWRAAHPATRNLWKLTEEGCRRALASPGKIYRAGKLAFRADGAWLRIALPSGRYLCYPNASLDGEGRLSYDGVHQYTRKWERIGTYGGKLVENCTQAAARDVFAHGMRAAEAAGYRVVLHVHDELICEVPDTEKYSAKELAKLMAAGPQWALGLPLAAAGFETYRYRKD